MRYLSSGKPITIRHLYYKLRTDPRRPLAEYLKPGPNGLRGAHDHKGYDEVSACLSAARYEGKVSYRAIREDGRRADIPLAWKSKAEWKKWCKDRIPEFRKPNSRPIPLEVWVEKAAIVSNELRGVCDEHQVILQCTEGQPSTTCILSTKERWRGVLPLIGYFGDADKPGYNIENNIENKLGVKLERLGLTEEDVEEFDISDDPEVDVLDDDEIAARAEKWIKANS